MGKKMKAARFELRLKNGKRSLPDGIQELIVKKLEDATLRGLEFMIEEMEPAETIANVEADGSVTVKFDAPTPGEIYLIYVPAGDFWQPAAVVKRWVPEQPWEFHVDSDYKESAK